MDSAKRLGGGVEKKTSNLIGTCWVAKSVVKRKIRGRVRGGSRKS